MRNQVAHPIARRILGGVVQSDWLQQEADPKGGDGNQKAGHPYRANASSNFHIAPSPPPIKKKKKIPPNVSNDIQTRKKKENEKKRKKKEKQFSRIEREGKRIRNVFLFLSLSLYYTLRVCVCGWFAFGVVLRQFVVALPGTRTAEELKHHYRQHAVSQATGEQEAYRNVAWSDF